MHWISILRLDFEYLRSQISRYLAEVASGAPKNDGTSEQLHSK